MFGMDLKDIMGASEKIQAFIPQIKKFIPQLVEMQNNYASKQNLKEGEFLLYSVILSKGGKIFLYGFNAVSAKENFSIGGVQFGKGCVVIQKELFKIELTQYLDIAEQQGVLGLLQTLPIGNLM